MDADTLAFLERALEEGERETLSLRLVFDANKKPTKEEVLALATAVREELFMSGWGLNFEWLDVKGEPNARLVVKESEARVEVVKP